ncbi:hypothetical protein SRHO_G00188110 [Serrasalmus rhombeus]
MKMFSFLAEAEPSLWGCGAQSVRRRMPGVFSKLALSELRLSPFLHRRRRRLDAKHRDPDDGAVQGAGVCAAESYYGLKTSALLDVSVSFRRWLTN